MFVIITCAIFPQMRSKKKRSAALPDVTNQTANELGGTTSTAKIPVTPGDSTTSRQTTAARLSNSTRVCIFNLMQYTLRIKI
jgi:hypothetical protein